MSFQFSAPYADLPTAVVGLSPAGKLLHVFQIAGGDGTTNVTFGPDEKDLYVTVVKDPNDAQAKGSVVKIPNAQLLLP